MLDIATLSQVKTNRSEFRHIVSIWLLSLGLVLEILATEALPLLLYNLWLWLGSGREVRWRGGRPLGGRRSGNGGYIHTIYKFPCL